MYEKIRRRSRATLKKIIGFDVVIASTFHHLRFRERMRISSDTDNIDRLTE